MHANFSNTTLRTCGSKETYEKICEASILKYQTEELGIDDVEYTDEVVGDE